MVSSFYFLLLFYILYLLLNYSIFWKVTQLTVSSFPSCPLLLPIIDFLPFLLLGRFTIESYRGYVRSHIGWRGERNILYKGVETSP